MLETVRAGRGDGAITRADFAPAFMLVALTSACSALMFARLPRDAGAALSGRAMAEAVAVAETEGGPAAPAVGPAGQAVRT